MTAPTLPSPSGPTTFPAPRMVWAPARYLFALTAFTCLLGTGLDIYWGTQNRSWLFEGAGFTTTFNAGASSAVNELFYFATLSNILLGVTCLVFALGPSPTSNVVHALRFSALVNVGITGLLFNLFIADDSPSDRLAETASFFQHIVNPVLAWVVFALFGPFGVVTRRRIAWAVVIPLAWIAVALVRGELFDWYPYHFMDVSALGYVKTSLNLAALLVVWLLLAGIALAVDHLRRSSDPASLFGDSAGDKTGDNLDAARRPLVKIVYFDEQSASDYLDISAGGSATTEATHIQKRTVDTQAKVQAKLVAKFSWLPFLGASTEGSAGFDTSHVGQSLLNKTLSNTILTDYLAAIVDDKRVRHMQGYQVSAPQGSMAHMKMYTPYMQIANTAQTGIDLSRFDAALESAKGYYELIAVSDMAEPSKCVLRFNISAFRNNYGLTDLGRMRLAFHVIHVGQTTEAGLAFAAEMNDEPETLTALDLLDDKETAEKDGPLLDVYDVVLAGVEHDDA